MTILVVTHDLGLAWNIADRVAVMYLGRIVELGPTEEMLSAPQHPYTRALLSVVPEAEEMEQQILEGEAPDPTRIPSGCRFHPRCPLVQSGEAERLGHPRPLRVGGPAPRAGGRLRRPPRRVLCGRRRQSAVAAGRRMRPLRQATRPG